MQLAPDTQTHMGTILCCICATPIAPNPASMCVNCIRSRVDITEDIPRTLSIGFCRGCGRYLQPPKNWVHGELESPAFLAFLLKRVRGLQKTKLVDARFIWTEPHSRRIKIRIAIQKEVFHGTILQQEFVVEFVVENQYCDDCHKANAEQSWKSIVQVRQKVPHMRTFLYLEQVLLKHNINREVLGMQEQPDGLDFYFQKKGDGQKFIDFLQEFVPLKYKMSQKLISHDAKSNYYNYKYTHAAEIVPVCKDDILVLPPKTARKFNAMGPVVIVRRVNNLLHLVDPNSLRTAQLTAADYWRAPFRVLADSTRMTSFTVLDVEPTGVEDGRLCLVNVEVARTSDLGLNDRTYHMRSHMGRYIQAGDECLGYDLVTAQMNNDILDSNEMYGVELPDVVLVRKVPQRKESKGFRLKRMAREAVDLRQGSRAQADYIARRADDEQRFYAELEDDEELRKNVNLYRGDTDVDVLLDSLTLDQQQQQQGEMEMG